MYIRGICTKCGNYQTFDVGNHDHMDYVEIMELLAKANFGSCQNGFHVEIGKMSDYYVLDFSKSFETREEAEKFEPFQEVIKDYIMDIPKVLRFMKDLKVEKDPLKLKFIIYVNGKFRLISNLNYGERIGELNIVDITVPYSYLFIARKVWATEVKRHN